MSSRKLNIWLGGRRGTARGYARPTYAGGTLTPALSRRTGEGERLAGTLAPPGSGSAGASPYLSNCSRRGNEADGWPAAASASSPGLESRLQPVERDSRNVALEDSLGLVSSDAKPAKAGTPNFEELAPVSGLWALSAFSLIELMIAIALLSLIVLGLLSMFTQTQRAFRDSMKQTDVQEAGRIAMDMLVRELEQITPSEIPGTVNFFTEVDEVYFGKKPMLQDLPGNPAGQQRTNLVQHFFFMSKVNQGYIGTGYQVIPDYPNGGVGSLYRYTSNTTKYLAPTLFRTFANLPAGMTKIADGVVHFRVVPFDTNGIILSPSTIVTNTYMFYDPIVPDQLSIWFSNNAVPAYLQMELAVLEPHILDRFRAMAPNTEAQKVYLSNHVGQVHLFRQRIPVRNVDFQAYK